MGSAFRVMHVLYSLRTGGLEQLVAEMAAAARQWGFEAGVVAVGGGGPVARRLEEAGVRWWALGKREGLRPGVIGRLAGVAGAWGADVIHAHNEGAGVYAAAAGRLCGIGVVTTRHGITLARAANRWVRRACGWMSRVNVCVSQALARQIQSEERLPPGRLRVIYNGVDTTTFAPRPGLRAWARAQLGVDGGGPVVMSVGRLVPEKDYPTLFKAVQALAEKWPGLKLVVIGGGEQEGLLRVLAEALAPGVVVMPGRAEGLEKLLPAADIFAMSSATEGIPRALLEAMACALPVVATAVGGVPEVVEHGHTGLLVPPGEALALARAIDTLLAAPERARVMGRAGRERVELMFSFDGMMRAYLRLYQELAGRG